MVRVAGEASRRRLDLIYLHVDGAAPAAIQAAVEHGGRLVDVRTRLTASAIAPAATPAVPARLATGDDEARVRLAAERLAPTSRFWADPAFPSEQVVEMYRRWSRRCLTGGVVAVPQARDVVAMVGAVVGADDTARVELVYVDSAAAGRGLGGTLVTAAVEALGRPRAEVSTQAGNVPALRLYEALGFRTAEMTALVHLAVDRL